MKSEMGFTYDQLLFDVSYQNLILLSSAIPSYDFDKDKKGKKAVGGNGQKTTKVGGLKGLFSMLGGEK